MACGVDLVGPRARNCQRDTTGDDCRIVRRTIHTQRQTAGHHQACPTQLPGELARNRQPPCSRVATAHDRDLWTQQAIGIAVDEKRQRRVGNASQQGRVISVLADDEMVGGMVQPRQRGLKPFRLDLSQTPNRLSAKP